MEEIIKDYLDYVGSRPDKHYKATLFESEHLMLGLKLSGTRAGAAHP